MKLPPFDYLAPRSLGEATRILAESGGAARVLAGGQSLMPVMAFRLATPEKLVDLRHVPGLSGIEIGPREARIGAMTRWRDIEESDALAGALPVLRAAIGHVAHYQIRNRGTIGGSLAHADPAAEMPAVAVTLDAMIDIAGNSGTRSIPAAELFAGALETSLAQDEIITAVRFPLWPAGRRWAFLEFARRRGDFALAGVVVTYDAGADGRVANARVGVFGATDIPRRLAAAEAALNGSRLDDLTLASACEAASAAVNPPSDIHGDADYRRSLVGTLLGRALRSTLPV